MQIQHIPGSNAVAKKKHQFPNKLPMNKALASLILSLAASAPVFAQNAIDEAMRRLEERSDVNVTHTERRNDNHKLVRTTTIINFDNNDYYRDLERAFEHERDKTVSVTITGGTYIFKFSDEAGTNSYLLKDSMIIKSWHAAGEDEE